MSGRRNQCIGSTTWTPVRSERPEGSICEEEGMSSFKEHWDFEGSSAEKGDGAELIWDKDDPLAIDFVTSATDLRMHSFSMNTKRFDIKSMSRNITPLSSLLMQWLLG